MTQRPFLHLPPAGRDSHERRTFEAIRGAKRGKLECNIDVTLNVSATSTTITDHRISSQTALVFDAMTANAAAMLAAGTLYVTEGNRTKGQAVITHPSSVSTDLTFRVCLIG